MKPKTLTTLGNLEIGDRYHYPKKDGVWQVVEKTATHVMVNQFAFDGSVQHHKYHDMKRSSTVVIFLRHTVNVQNSIISSDELSDKIK